MNRLSKSMLALAVLSLAFAGCMRAKAEKPKRGMQVEHKGPMMAKIKFPPGFRLPGSRAVKVKVKLPSWVKRPDQVGLRIETPEGRPLYRGNADKASKGLLRLNRVALRSTSLVFRLTSPMGRKWGPFPTRIGQDQTLRLALGEKEVRP